MRFAFPWLFCYNFVLHQILTAMKHTFILVAMGLLLMEAAPMLQAQSDSTFIVNGVSFTMKIVPGGEMLLGSQRGNPDLPNYDKECWNDCQWFIKQLNDNEQSAESTLRYSKLACAQLPS